MFTGMFTCTRRIRFYMNGVFLLTKNGIFRLSPGVVKRSGLLIEKLKKIQKEYEKKQRKLKKCNRVQRAKDHVKKTLRELTTVPVNNTDSTEVTQASNLTENASKESLKNVQHSNAQQESNSGLACGNDKSIQKADQDENVKSFDAVHESNTTDTKPDGIHSSTGSAGVDVKPNEEMAFGVDENSCSQDIFSSPKPTSRNIFDDIQKSVLNKSDLEVSSKRPALIELVSNDNLTGVSEQFKDVLNVDTKVSVDELDNNNKKNKISCDSYHKDKEVNKIVKGSSIDIVNKFASPINSTNSASETKSKHAKALKESGQVAIEITETLAKRPKEDSEVVLAVSETPTDSDWTISSSIDMDDFVNVKSRSRKRRSSSAKRRQSLRIAELSSQESSQSNSESLLADLYISSHKQKSKHMNKTLEVSSIFHCLLDEAKRKNTNSEFSLPPDFSEEFKHLQMDAENKVPEVISKPESLEDTTAQCVTEDVNMKESKTSRPLDESNGTELSLIEKADCKEEEEEMKGEENLQLELFHNENSDIMNLTELTADKMEKNPTSELTVQVSDDMEGDGDDNAALQNSENISCMSPPLFESQTDTCIADSELPDTDTDSKDADTESDTFSSPQVGVREMKLGARASPAGVAVLPGDKKEAVETVGLSLEQALIFQVPKADQLVSLVMGEAQEKLHIVCLCSANLRFYHLQDNQWSCYHTEKLGFLVKKNSGCGITLVSGTGSELYVVLQQRKTDSVKLTLYTSKELGVSSYHVDCLWSRSVLLCPTMQGEFIASYATDQKTYLTKYTLTDNSDKQRQNFDPVLDEITSLCNLRGQDAIVGLSVTSQLYVWNRRLMSLLTTVDISDVSIQDMMCSHAFYEEGFLFLAVFSKRKSRQAGSVFVINPQMGTSETLTALETRNQKWTGYSSAVLVQDEHILVRENSGSLAIWDLYSGKLVSTVKETSVSCFASTCHSVTMCHKQCVHVYNIVDR